MFYAHPDELMDTRAEAGPMYSDHLDFVGIENVRLSFN